MNHTKKMQNNLIFIYLRRFVWFLSCRIKGEYYRHTFKFRASDYPNSFISQPNDIECEETTISPVPHIIYVFWTGDNELTENRKRCLKSMQDVCGVEVKLITPENLNEYILPDDPLPEAYQYLSCVHRADYLRTYFMYHHGGGYADIKEHLHSWLPAFEKLEKSSKYICSYREDYNGVATVLDDVLYKAMKKNWMAIVGNVAFICRPHTQFTEDWHRETKKRLIDKTDELRLHPATTPFGDNPDYPIKWTYFQGDVFHPLCLKYHDKIMQDNRIKPSFKNYR